MTHYNGHCNSMIMLCLLKKVLAINLVLHMFTPIHQGCTN